MDPLMTLAIVAFILLPVIAFLSLYLSLKLFRIEKPSVWIWFGLNLLAMFVSLSIGGPLAYALLPESPAWGGFVVGEAISIAILALVLTRQYKVPFLRVIGVLIVTFIISSAIMSSLSQVSEKVIHRKQTLSDNGMQPALSVNDQVLVQSMLNSHKTGDVVARANVYDKTIYARRIIAVPGEEVEIREGRYFINNEERVFPLDKKVYIKGIETDFPIEKYRNASLNMTKTKLGEKQYLIASDNQNVENPYEIISIKGDGYILGRVSAHVVGQSIFSKDGITNYPVK